MKKKMNVLILGSSLEDNIVASKLYRSSFVQKLYCLESNPYLKEYCESIPIEMVNYAALARFAQQQEVEYVFSASYKAILAKTVDYLRSQGLKVISTKDAPYELFSNRTDYRKLLSSYALSVPPSRLFDMYGDAVNYAEDTVFPVAVKTNDPGMSITSLCKNAEQVEEFLSFTTKSIRYREEEVSVVFEKYIKGGNMHISGIVDQQEILLFPHAYSVKTTGEPSYKSLWLCSGNSPKSLYKNWESMVLIPAIHAVHSHRGGYRGPLCIDVVFDQKNPYIVDFRAEWDALYLQAMMHSLESDLFSLFSSFYDGIPLEQIEPKWKDGVLGFLLPVTEETGLYVKSFAQSLKKMPSQEKGCSIQVTEGIKEFPGNYEKLACITIKAPGCKEAKEFLLSRWHSARLPEDFPVLEKIDSLVMKDW